MTNYSMITKGIGASSRILMISWGENWSLLPHSHFAADAINKEVENNLDINVTTLECIYEFSDGPDDNDASRIYLHEIQGPVPPHIPYIHINRARWVNAAELEYIPLAVPEHKSVLRKWFAEVSSGRVPRDRLPWARRGWFASASAWASSTLQDVGLKVAGPAQQIHSRIWSYLLCIPVTSGNVYLKASPPAFSHEPLVTQLLSKWFPGNIPSVIAVDSHRRWTLMHSFRQACNSEDPSKIVDDYLTALPIYAGIQQYSVQHIPKLLSLGCPDHRLINLPDRYDELFTDETLLYPDDAAGLSTDDRDRLVAFSPVFRQICAELGAAELPESIVHGDLWRGNFAVSDNSPIIFDWAEAVISHPLVSLTVAIRDISSSLPDSQHTVAHVKDSYLAEWREFASPDRLKHLCDMTSIPAIVSRTLLWRDALAGIEEDRRLFYRYAVPVNLRRLLPHLDLMRFSS